MTGPLLVVDDFAYMRQASCKPRVVKPLQSVLMPTAVSTLTLP